MQNFSKWKHAKNADIILKEIFKKIQNQSEKQIFCCFEIGSTGTSWTLHRHGSLYLPSIKKPRAKKSKYAQRILEFFEKGRLFQRSHIRHQFFHFNLTMFIVILKKKYLPQEVFYVMRKNCMKNHSHSFLSTSQQFKEIISTLDISFLNSESI